MNPTAANAFVLEGNVSPLPPTSNSYVRVERAGPVANYIEFEKSAYLGGTVPVLPPGTAGRYTVSVATQLHFSDYPLPVTPPVVPIRPIHRTSPPPQGFFGADGSELSVDQTGDEITGFHGNDKTGAAYRLSIEAKSVVSSEQTGRWPE